MDNKSEGKLFLRTIIGVVAILVVAAFGFIVYDKVLNKEKPPVPTPTTTPEGKEDVEKPIETIKVNKGELREVKLSTSTYRVQLDTDYLDIRIGKVEGTDIGGPLYINNSAISEVDVPEKTIDVTNAYITNDVIIFTTSGQKDQVIVYAMGTYNTILLVGENDYQMHDIHMENGEIVATGVSMSDPSSEKKLLIKYENNVVTIEPIS